MKAAELYEKDFSEWARQNAELLRSGRVGDADLEHIAEEIEDMVKRERRALRRRLIRLMQHLLKWQYQPDRRSSSWERTIAEQRDGIHDLLRDSPSLRGAVAGVIAEAYPLAVKYAAIDTLRAATDFPSVCPYMVPDLLNETYLP